MISKRLPRVLICDDDSLYHLMIKHSLKGQYEWASAYSGEEALAILKTRAIDAVMLDIEMGSPDEGFRLIPRFREIDPEIVIIMSSGRKDFAAVREALLLGATDYVPKDSPPEDVMISLARVLERRSLVQRRNQQSFELLNTSRHAMIGESKPILFLRRVIERVRVSPANVVITGETGTGKEVVARQLRGRLPDGSPAPFQAVDSATITSTMAESLLFGHEKGAFTGAERAVKGIFEEADGGIVYFDEVGNMPLEIQAKLLRVLQEKEVTRVGSPRAIPLDFRVVCATNLDLEKMVEQGTFKADLLQRLNVIPVSIPPLRERREDIPALIAHFQKRDGGNRALHFSNDAVEALKAHSWPGNVRELSNLVSYVTTMAEGPEICLADLPPRLREAAAPRPSATDAGEGFYARVASLEKSILTDEYGKTQGNVSRLALKLGMDRSHLYTKLREHGIHGAKGAAKI